MSQVVVVGSLNVDLTIRVPHMPMPGETIIGYGFRSTFGGKGANQAIAAARLGAQVALIGRIGADDSGKRLLANLGAEGVETTHVGVDQDHASGLAMITLDESGQNSIVVAPGANMGLKPEHITAAWEALRNADAIVVSLEIPLDCVSEAVSLAHASGVPVVLNPAPAQLLPDELLRQVDVLIPNETEAALLTGFAVDSDEQITWVGRSLCSRGVGAVVMSLGARGACLRDGNGQKHWVPAHSVEVVDTTGAGDAFVAALTVSLAEGASLVEAARLANAAGALAVTRLGAQEEIPTRVEVKRFLQETQTAERSRECDVSSKPDAKSANKRNIPK